VSSNINKLLYRQAVIWVGSAVAPALPALGVITSVILYFVTFLEIKVSKHFPDKPIADASRNVFNHLTLLVTLTLSVVPIVLLLLESDFYCGPSWSEPLAAGLEMWRLFPIDGVRNATELINQYLALLLLGVLVLVLIVLYLAVQVIKKYRRKSRNRKAIERTATEQKQKQEKRFEAASLLV